MFRSLIFISSALLFIGPTLAEAQTWPTTTVKLVVGFPAGSSPDIAARIIAPALSKKLGQPVVVENKPGAGGNIGVSSVTKATDGHTIGLTTNGPLTTSNALYSTPGFNVKADVAPLALVSTSPLVLVVPSKGGPNSLEELIDRMKSTSKGLSFGSVGAGSGAHLTAELFNQRLKTNSLHVPYAGFPAVLNDLSTERIDYGFVAPSIADPMIKAGRIRALGITSSGIYAAMPDLKPIASVAAVNGFFSEVWLALFHGKNLPSSATETLRGAVQSVLSDPDIRKKFTELSWVYVGGTSQALSTRINEDTAKWEPLIKKLQIKSN
jgi:tripartite-type tricarboxylate transporter receptor subunit TctC